MNRGEERTQPDLILLASPQSSSLLTFFFFFSITCPRVNRVGYLPLSGITMEARIAEINITLGAAVRTTDTQGSERQGLLFPSF